MKTDNQLAALAMHVNLVDALVGQGISEYDAENVAEAVTQGWMATQANEAEALRDTGREAGRREADRRFRAAADHVPAGGNGQVDDGEPIESFDQGRTFGRQMAERRFGKRRQ